MLCAAALPLLAACGGGGGSDAQASQVGWVVLGSSSAAGEGATPGNGWVARLQADQAVRGVTVTNLAQKFTLTYHALPAAGTPPPPGRPAPDPARNTDRALASKPQLVLLSFPSNDANAAIPAAETAANLRAMRAALAAGGAKALVLGTQPRNVFSESQRASQAALDRQLAADFGPCFVPLADALAGPDGQIAVALGAGDGVHLNDDGHAVILQRVQAAYPGCLR